MAVHTLVTGVPGAGKTLYTLSMLAKPLVGSTITTEDGREIERRLIVGNVRDLLLPHEPMTVPAIDPEQYREPHPDLDRQPGEPPLEVEHSVHSWWLWCQPGDVLIVDECLRAFRPVAAGRKVPQFIAKLETARHYGVEFIFVTQHPQLLHINVRNLVGRHMHVRRLFAGMQTIVYEWDHCTHPDKTKNATATPWRHKKAAFGIYKSAEIHTKGKASVPIAIWALIAAAIALPVLFYVVKGRIIDRNKEQATTSAEQNTSPGQTPGTSPGQTPAGQPVELPTGPAPRYVAPVGPPAFAHTIKPRATWPEQLAGCWQQEGQCSCITQEDPPRILTDKHALCMAVMDGTLVPPKSHPRPERAPEEPPMGASSPALPQT